MAALKCQSCDSPIEPGQDQELVELFGDQYCSWECERWDNACPCCVAAYGEDE